MYSLNDFTIVLANNIADAAPVVTNKTGLALAWAANGGDESAKWTESGNADDLWQWMNRLGRNVEVYDPFAERIWEGFVYGVRAEIEGRSLAISLDGMANKTAIMYSYVEYLCPSSGDFKINGTPSGSTLVYDDGAGGDPVGEIDLVGLSGGTTLFNTTQDEEAEVVSVDGSTNQIAFVDPVPGTWTDNDDLRYGSVMGRDMTAWVSDVDSQARYGVKERLVSRSGMNATVAAAKNAALLELWRWPLGEQGRGSSGGAQRQNFVTVEAVGWWARCQWRLWHWTGRGVLSAQDQAKLIRSEVLDFLDADESLIMDIGHSFTRYREDYNTAQQELLALAELGVANTDGRALVGVERGKRLFLRAASTEDRYIMRTGGRWFNVGQQRLEPWRVRPDGYVVAEDLIPATVVLAGVADPSRFYLERVEWQWPDVVTPTPLGGRDLEDFINRGIKI